MRVWIPGTVLLAAATAVAQPKKPEAPQPAPAPVRAGTSVAPPDEEGFTTVVLPGGYLRFKDDAPAEPGEGGGLTVVPSLPPSAPAPERAPEPAREARPEQPRPPHAPIAMDRCRTERQHLARRLMELRGVELDGPTAELVLASPQPFSAHVQRSMFGLPAMLAGGDWLLSTAVSSDSEARDRARSLAHCLQAR